MVMEMIVRIARNLTRRVPCRTVMGRSICMRYHHTKNKGDLGVVKAIADMVDKGWRILLPMSEHDPYDFVAYDGERFVRVQAKYRAAVRGSILLELKANWSDRNGLHKVHIDKDAIDLVCLYCPDSDRCYYFRPQDVEKCI